MKVNDGVFNPGQIFVLDNLKIVLDKKHFVHADGRGIKLFPKLPICRNSSRTQRALINWNIYPCLEHYQVNVITAISRRNYSYDIFESILGRYRLSYSWNCLTMWYLRSAKLDLCRLKYISHKTDVTPIYLLDKQSYLCWSKNAKSSSNMMFALDQSHI